MTFDPDARLDPSQVEDRRGQRSMGGGLPMGGPIVVSGGSGVILVLLVVAAMALGVNPFEAGPASVPEGDVVDSRDTVAQCQTGADAQTRTDCRVVGYVDSVQKYWADDFARRGLQYTPSRTVLFSGHTQAGCGLASEEQGPFYCPLDKRVYLDVAFFDDLRTRFGGSGGSFAEGYVIAHEYGHHVQDLLGILQANSGTGPTSASVAQELMADCLAGVWANHAAATGYLRAPSDQEISDALNTAAAVGDDRIQRATQGRVQPERWTHGSAQQRQNAFRTGYRSGDLRDCGA